MSLRSPTKHENGGTSLHTVPSSTRHSRARGNLGLFGRISLDTRFRGYDGTQAGLFVLIPKQVFSKESTKFGKEILILNLCAFAPLRENSEIRSRTCRVNLHRVALEHF